jgi:hypothetical protein
MWMIFVYDFREEILSIVALLSSESVFVMPPNKREKAVAAHKKFFSPSGDHITLLNIYRSFSMVTQKKVSITPQLNKLSTIFYYMLYLPNEYGGVSGMIISKGTKILGRNLQQCCFAHHKIQ